MEAREKQRWEKWKYWELLATNSEFRQNTNQLFRKPNKETFSFFTKFLGTAYSRLEQQRFDWKSIFFYLISLITIHSKVRPRYHSKNQNEILQFIRVDSQISLFFTKRAHILRRLQLTPSHLPLCSKLATKTSNNYLEHLLKTKTVQLICKWWWFVANNFIIFFFFFFFLHGCSPWFFDDFRAMNLFGVRLHGINETWTTISFPKSESV